MASLIEAVGHFLSPEWDYDYACCRETILFTNFLFGIFLLLDTFLFVLFIYVYARNKTLHANFRVILLVFAVSDMLLLYHRVADFWLTGRIDRENGFTYSIKMNSWAILIFSLCNLIGERSFSLYAYNWYHDAYRRFPITMISIYAIQEITVGVLIWKRVISKRFMFHCMAATLLLTSIFLIAIYRISRRRHRQMMAMRFQWSDGDSLSRRHRTMEILRETRLLQIFLPYLARIGTINRIFILLTELLLKTRLISSVLQISKSMITLHFVIPLEKRHYLLVHSIFYLTVSVWVLFDLLIPMLAHPIIKAEAKKTLRSLIRRFLRRKQVAIEVTPVQRLRPSTIHSTNGQKLSFSPEQEKDIYFAGYNQLWDTPGTR